MFISSLKYTNLYFYISVAIAILLPFTEYFSTQFTSIAIILLFICWLFLTDKKEVFHKLRENKIILLFIAIYFININGLFREGVDGVSEKILLKKLSLFLLPVIIGTSPELDYKQIHRILWFFFASLLISTFFTYSNGITYLLRLQDDITDVANVLIIHRPYYGLFCAFTILNLLYFTIRQQKFTIRIFFIVSVIYLFIFIAIIYAKMAIIAILLSVIFLSISWLFFKKQYKYILILIGVFLLSMAFVYQTKPSLKKHIITILSGKDFSFREYNVVLVGSINTRYVNWGCAFKVLSANNNWIYGVGPGNAQEELQECYKTRNEWVYRSKMNAHNQYIEETLHNGIPGLSLFIISLLVSVRIAYKRKDLLFLSFLSIFILCCITESILTRQIGIIFYAFFNSLLLFNVKR